MYTYILTQSKTSPEEAEGGLVAQRRGVQDTGEPVRTPGVAGKVSPPGSRLQGRSGDLSSVFPWRNLGGSLHVKPLRNGSARRRKPLIPKREMSLLTKPGRSEYELSSTQGNSVQQTDRKDRILYAKPIEDLEEKQG